MFLISVPILALSIFLDEEVREHAKQANGLFRIIMGFLLSFAGCNLNGSACGRQGLESVVKKNSSAIRPWQIPTDCPACDTRLEKVGQHHFCKNWKCPEQVCARLHHFASMMNIRLLGPKTMDRLVTQRQVQKPEDLYKLDTKKLKAIQGFSDRKINAIKAALERSRNESFETVLAAIGVKGLGTANIRKLKQAGFDSLEKITHASVKQLAQIDGIGRQTAEQIIRGFKPQILQTASALRALGLNI